MRVHVYACLLLIENVSFAVVSNVAVLKNGDALMVSGFCHKTKDFVAANFYTSTCCASVTH